MGTGFCLWPYRYSLLLLKRFEYQKNCIIFPSTLIICVLEKYVLFSLMSVQLLPCINKINTSSYIYSLNSHHQFALVKMCRAIKNWCPDPLLYCCM